MLATLQLSGDQDDLDLRPARMHSVREHQAVHCSRHLNVGKQQRDIGSGVEDGNSFGCIHCLDWCEAGVRHHIDGVHSQQHLVFDDENERGDNGVIKEHRDRRLHE